MADFNAGSIEGSLDLNLDPFERGLARASAQAAEWERTHQNIGAGMGDATSTARLDDGSFDRSLTEDRARLDAFGSRTATATVDVDTAPAVAKIMALNHALDSVDAKVGGVGMPGTFGMLIALAAAIAPAFGPAIAAVGLFGAAAGAGMLAAVGSAMLYVQVVKSALGPIMDAIAAHKQLTGEAGKMETAIEGIEHAWSQLTHLAEPGILKALTPAAQMVEGLIPRLLPLINAMSSGLARGLQPLEAFFQRDDFAEFLSTITHLARQDIPLLGQTLTHVLAGAMDLFDSLSPIINIVAHDIDNLSAKFENWANIKSNSYIQNLFGYIHEYAPQTEAMLGGLFGFLGHLASSLGPLVGPALDFLTSLTSALSSLNLSPLSAAIGTVLEALRPFMKDLADIVNVLLPPLATLAGTLVQDFVTPLARGLSSQLNPLLHQLAGFLQELSVPLGQFISSIANLANPTGIGFIAAALEQLMRAVQPLIGPVGRLAVALEGMVDTDLAALTPAIRPLGDALTGLAHGIAPLVSGLAWFVGHQSVALTILAIAGAIKAWSLAQAALAGVRSIAGLVATLIELGPTAVGVYAIAAAEWVAAAATTAWSIAVAILTSPITLVILALAALGVAIYEVVHHWGAIKDAAKDVWDWIKDKWSDVGSLVSKPFHSAVTDVENVWNKIKSATTRIAGDVLNWLRHNWGELLIGILTGPFGFIIAEVVGHWTTIREKTVSIVNDVLSWLRGHWQAILQIITGPLGQLIGLVQAHWAPVQAFFQSIPGKVEGALSGAGQWLVGLGSALLNGFLNGIQNAWGAVIGFVESIPGKITGAIGDLSGVLLGAGEHLIDGLGQGIENAAGGVLSKASSIAGKIKGLFGGSPVEWGPLLPWNTGAPGRSLMEKLAAGITGNQHLALNAATAVAGGVGLALTPSSPTLAFARAGLTPVGGTAPGVAPNDETPTLLRSIRDALTNQDPSTLADTLTEAFTRATNAANDRLIRIQRQNGGN